MSLDLIFLGKKLKNCREQLYLDVHEVSQKTGISTDKIYDFEEGKTEPSGDEILIFSDFYKQDYRYFISNQSKTASDQIDILYRKFGQEFTKDDRWAVQEFIYLCENEEQILRELDIQSLNFNFKIEGNFYKKHGHDAAVELRKKLGYSPNHVITDIYSDFRKIGIHIFRRKLKNTSFSGLFINHPWAGKCILVNFDEDIYRQNFTVTHEVGHAIFDFNESVNVSLKNSDKENLREIRANTFASNYLIPLEALHNLKISQWNKELILQLANKLKVNVETLLISLKNIGQLNEDQYNRFRNEKLPRDQKEDPELNGLTDKRKEAKLSLLKRGLSSFYVRHCYEAYSRGIISAKRLAEILLTDEIELPEILSLFNYSLSYDN